MTRLYWYSLAIIFLSCCGAGLIIGYAFGIGGSILGCVLGAMVASGVAMALNTPQKMEAAVYSVLGVGTVVVLIYLIISLWGVRI